MASVRRADGRDNLSALELGPGPRAEFRAEAYEPTERDWADYRAYLAEVDALARDRRDVLEAIRLDKVCRGRLAVGRIRGLAAALEAAGHEWDARQLGDLAGDVEMLLTLVP